MDTGGAYVGEAAALATALSWAVASLAFAAAARRASAPILNLVRVVAATAVLGVAVALAGADRRVPPMQLLAIAASGVVGLAMGDAAYFRGLRILGPRRTMLLHATWPAIAAVLMVPLLDESLGAPGILGMCVTLGAVLWVQTERDDGTEVRGVARHGVAWGLLGALGQAGGYVLVKVGLGAAPAGSWLAAALDVPAVPGAAVAGEPVAPLLATLLRMASAAVVLVALAAGRFRPAGLREALRDVRFLRLAGAGVALGPVLGVWLSLVAVSHANTAVAGTIIGTSPVLVIPLTRIVHGHRTTWRGWAGALVALGGVALLTFRRTF